MGCKFNDFNGKCQLYNEGIENPGVDEEGNCICDEDPDPTILCETYTNNEYKDEYEDEYEDDLDLENEEE